MQQRWQGEGGGGEGQGACGSLQRWQQGRHCAGEGGGGCLVAGWHSQLHCGAASGAGHCEAAQRGHGAGAASQGREGSCSAEGDIDAGASAHGSIGWGKGQGQHWAVLAEERRSRWLWPANGAAVGGVCCKHAQREQQLGGAVCCRGEAAHCAGIEGSGRGEPGDWVEVRRSAAGCPHAAHSPILPALLLSAPFPQRQRQLQQHWRAPQH